jgi:uncharacterized protein DUF4384
MNTQRALLLGILLLAAVPSGTARAVSRVPEGAGAAGGQRLTVDVWINKEEGGVYRPGESMRVFFRSNADANVLVYNIDTEGYIHLVYPYGPADPLRVEAGRTYLIPARHDPYDLVADGPPGMEFVVAVASRQPFQNLPWYLTSGAPESQAPRDEDGEDDEMESGVIVGDPYVGMEKINRRILPSLGEEDSDASETYFYIEKRVEYPRYVCADCHYSAFGFDPYLSVCPVVDIRIDATWVRYAPTYVRTARPRYYYYVRPSAPTRYRAWKDRWSSIDGGTALRSRFVVERSQRSVRTREMMNRREPPEFRDLRRSRPGRLWQGRDEVLKLWEQDRAKRQQGRNTDPRSGKARPKVAPPADQGRGQDRDRGQDREQYQERDRGQDRDKGQDRGREQSKPQEREREQSKPQERERERPPDKGQDQKYQEHRDKGQDRDRGQDRRDQGDAQRNQGGWRDRNR